MLTSDAYRNNDTVQGVSENHCGNVTLLILRVQVIVDFIIHWIIRPSSPTLPADTTRNHCFRLCAKLEMLCQMIRRV